VAACSTPCNQWLSLKQGLRCLQSPTAAYRWWYFPKLMLTCRKFIVVIHCRWVSISIRSLGKKCSCQKSLQWVHSMKPLLPQFQPHLSTLHSAFTDVALKNELYPCNHYMWCRRALTIKFYIGLDLSLALNWLLCWMPQIIIAVKLVLNKSVSQSLISPEI